MSAKVALVAGAGGGATGRATVAEPGGGAAHATTWFRRDRAHDRPAWDRAGLLAHAIGPQAVAAVIAVLISDAAALMSGAILPAYGTCRRPDSPSDHN